MCGDVCQPNYTIKQWPSCSILEKGLMKTNLAPSVEGMNKTVVGKLSRFVRFPAWLKYSRSHGRENKFFRTPIKKCTFHYYFPRL